MRAIVGLYRGMPIVEDDSIQVSPNSLGYALPQGLMASGWKYCPVRGEPLDAAAECCAGDAHHPTLRWIGVRGDAIKYELVDPTQSIPAIQATAAPERPGRVNWIISRRPGR